MTVPSSVKWALLFLIPLGVASCGEDTPKKLLPSSNIISAQTAAVSDWKLQSIDGEACDPEKTVLLRIEPATPAVEPNGSDCSGAVHVRDLGNGKLQLVNLRSANNHNCYVEFTREQRKLRARVEKAITLGAQYSMSGSTLTLTLDQVKLIFVAA